MSIPFTLVIVLLTVVFQIAPGFTRPDLCFSVTVDPAFRLTAAARGILRRYRVVVWVFGLATIGLQFATGLMARAVLIPFPTPPLPAPFARWIWRCPGRLFLEDPSWRCYQRRLWLR